MRRHGPLPPYRWAGWYDLRLRLAEQRLPFRLPERLATVLAGPEGKAGQFAYVDPRHRPLQEEMEQAVTAHLKRIGAFLPPGGREVPAFPDPFPVEASVIIPVKNRAKTVGEAWRAPWDSRPTFPST